MDTFFARNRFSAYLDGTLPDSEAAEVEAALAEDPALREEFDDMRRAVDLLHAAGPVTAPEGFHARVMAAVDSEPAPGGVISLFRRTLNRIPVEALALAAAAVIVVVVIQGKTGQEAGDDDVAAQLDVTLPSRSSTLDRAATDPEELADASPAGDDTTAGSEGQAMAKGDAAAPPAPTKAIATPATADGDLRTGSASGSSSRAAARDKRTKVVASRGVDDHGEAYYSGWEQQGIDEAQAQQAPQSDAGASTELSQGIDMAGPKAYRLAMADSEVLYELSAAAESAGGRMTDSKGDSLVPHELPADDAWLQVQLVVPRERADGVTRRLRDMGGLAIPPPRDNVMYGPEWAVFIIDVNHQP